MNKYYILVPVYKVENYIDQCIKSVINQTYYNFQLILVDDGSPDKSGEICDEYAKNDNRIHVIHQNNQGLISAREAAKMYVMNQEDLLDSYIVYLDSDDSLKKNALEIIDRTIQTYKCDMVIYGFDRVLNGNVVKKFNSKYLHTKVVTDKRILYKIVFNHFSYNSLCRKAISADLLSDTDYSQLFHISHGEDLLQSLPYYAKCQKVAFIKDSLYNYTENPNSITNTINYETYKTNSFVRSTVWDFLKHQNVWDDRDFEEYLVYLHHLVEKKIRLIAGFNTEIENKFRLFDEMRSDTYYSMVLKSRKSSDKILNLLASGEYTKLCRIACKKNPLKVLYRYFKMRKRI